MEPVKFWTACGSIEMSAAQTGWCSGLIEEVERRRGGGSTYMAKDAARFKHMGEPCRMDYNRLNDSQ
jgi:hypothetical protein